MATITKSAIAKHLEDKFGFSKHFADHLVTEIFGEITEIIAEDSKMKIPNFGRFEVRSKKERPGRNMNTKEKIVIAARRVVRFVPSRVLKETINHE